MFAANRSLKADDITLAFERYKKLSQQTARNIVTFYERRVALRTQATKKDKKIRGQKTAKEDATDDCIVVLPSPSLAPT